MYTEYNTNTKTTLIFIYISTMNDAMMGREIQDHTCVVFHFCTVRRVNVNSGVPAKTTCHFPACAAICAAIIFMTFAIIARFASRSAFSSSCR